MGTPALWVAGHGSVSGLATMQASEQESEFWGWLRNSRSLGGFAWLRIAPNYLRFCSTFGWPG
jgi:amino acid permease